MKKKISVLLASVMVIGALAACGGDPGKDTQKEENPGQAEDGASTGDEAAAGDETPDGGEAQATAEDVNWDEIEARELIVNSTKNETADAALIAYCDRITERTNGKITFSFFWGGSLAKANEAVDALQAGTCDMMQINVSNFENLFPLNSTVLAVPMMGMSMDTTEVYPELAAKHPELGAEFEAQNLHMFSYTMTAPYNLYINSDKDITVPDDLSGKKLICLQQNIMNFLSDKNCAPVQAGYADFFTSIQGGVADGIITHAGPVIQQGITDQINQELIFGEGSGMYMELVAYCMGNDVWNSLPEAVQQVFVEEAEEFHKQDQQVNNGMCTAQKEAAEAAGHRYWVMTEEEIEPWKEAMEPYIQNKIDEISALPGCENFQEIYEDALSMIEAAK